MANKTILITGAGTGIGLDSVNALAERGHKVIATTFNEEQADTLKQTLADKIQIFKLDITNEDDRNKIRDLDVDVLINNAALGDSGSLAEVDMDRIRRIFEVNLFSTLELSQIAIGEMIANGGGTVIFMSSIAGRVPFPFLMPYSMTKFALSAAAARLREEMAVLNKGINISVIEPGAFHTGFNQSMTHKKFEWMNKKSLFSREQIEKIRRKENREFKLFEEKNTESIIRKIVLAAEAKEPKLRYVAPWMQGAFIHFKRVLGA